MGRDNACRICEKKYSSNFANLFDSKVKVHGCENYIISYFEAIQQLTGVEVCTERKAICIFLHCVLCVN